MVNGEITDPLEKIYNTQIDRNILHKGGRGVIQVTLRNTLFSGT